MYEPSFSSLISSALLWFYKWYVLTLLVLIWWLTEEEDSTVLCTNSSWCSSELLGWGGRTSGWILIRGGKISGLLVAGTTTDDVELAFSAWCECVK